jgi:lipid-binding SYLF domain-containing protein
MKMTLRLPGLAMLAAAALAFLPGCSTNDPVTRTNAANASASQIASDSRAALASLYARNHSARALGPRAKAVLVFPSVTRAGFMVGGQAGNGAMFRRDGRVSGFFQTASASWGLQAGVQKFSYALFLMDDAAVRNLNRAGGWELGGSPSLVVVDRGMAGNLSTTTANRGTYAFFFDQRGLMAGLGLQGTKITRINPGR